MAKQVGEVTLEDGNGHPLAVVHCSAPAIMRPSDIRYEGRVYHQNRVDDAGRWVYRAFWGASAGTVADDPSITLVQPVEPEPEPEPLVGPVEPEPVVEPSPEPEPEAPRKTRKK